MQTNGRERILRVLDGERPDAVPVGELVIDPKVIRGMGKGYEDAVDMALGEDVSLITAVARFDPVETRDDGTYIDEWGCTYKSTEDVIAHPIKDAIAVGDDIDHYDFPDPEAPHRLGDLERFVAKADGKVAINFHSRVAFMWSVYLMGMDNLLMAMAMEPDYVHALLTRVADLNIRVIRRAVRAEATTVSLGDDYCSNRGPLMSPTMFREFILPHFARAVEAIHEEGGRCIKHCDGNLWPILDDMVETGIDAINPLEPVAGMKVSEVKQRYGDRLAIMGNIDCADLLCYGTEADVERTVKQCITDGGEDGGLIVSSSNSIHHGVNPRNYLAMIRAIHEHGSVIFART